MAEQYGSSKIVVLEYHSGDEFSNSKSEERAKWYSVRGFPTAKFDGVKSQVGASEDVSSQYKPIIDSELANSALLTISLSGVIGAENGQIKATITPVTMLPESNLTLNWVVYEDNLSVKGKSKRVVVRDVLSSDNLTVNNKQPINMSKTFALNPTWNHANVGLVVFVQDNNTKKVLQTAVFKAGK